jgi:hypothetical protein
MAEEEAAERERQRQLEAQREEERIRQEQSKFEQGSLWEFVWKWKWLFAAMLVNAVGAIILIILDQVNSGFGLTFTTVAAIISIFLPFGWLVLVYALDKLDSYNRRQTKGSLARRLLSFLILVPYTIILVLAAPVLFLSNLIAQCFGRDAYDVPDIYRSIPTAWMGLDSDLLDWDWLY